MLLSSIGKHVQLSKVSGTGENVFMFPATTMDDVIADENGTNLTTYLPKLTTTAGETSGALTALENGTAEISSTVMNALINA